MNAAVTDFLDVTELAGEPISQEQLERLRHRYVWAAELCAGKDCVELACGSGAGLGLLKKAARSFEAADYSTAMLDRVRLHYGQRIRLQQFDAQSMPYEDQSKDVLLIFEAIYYLPNVDRFIRECQRVLRPGGCVLVVTCNKDLFDFNPSPHSYTYLGVAELTERFGAGGFGVQCYGYFPIAEVSGWQKRLRPIKRLAVRFHLMPKTMRGKRLLKRIVFGKLATMPAEIISDGRMIEQPTPLPASIPDRDYKIIYCVASLPGKSATDGSPDDVQGFRHVD